VTSQS